MDFRLEGAAHEILVEESVYRDFTAETKLNKNSSPLTYDSRMGLGLSGCRIQTSDIFRTPFTFATTHTSVDLTPATHLYTRHITYLHTP